MAIDFENTKKLKPCPICGQDDRIALWTDESGRKHKVTCFRCGVETWVQWDTADAIEKIIKRWDELPRKEELTARDAAERKDGEEA